RKRSAKRQEEKRSEPVLDAI
ncbi:hypothetical protein CLOM_g16383, partial [Closterium sp. NIES-68]